MARASGDAADGLLPGTFLHKTSGVDYRLFLRDGRAWLAYNRADASPERSLHGEQELSYYIGSGNRGRAYLFQREGFWFESPVNWYSKKQLWDMNPKSLDAKQMPFTLPIDASCLHCHTSGVQRSLPGSRDHWSGPPFLYGGITCESCHGDPTQHLAQNGHGPILNPAALPTQRRVSVCLQCHLEGEFAVNRLGKSLATFVPGEDLSDDVRLFVRAGEQGANGRAVSQWESLQQSACFRKSGGRLTCTTCHDPHDVPAPAERVVYFRGKCTACHNDAAFLARHHPEQPDCASCHMLREPTENVAHEQVTDHFIRTRPVPQPETIPSETLRAVNSEPVSSRDLGLAYAQMAVGGDTSVGPEARHLLEQAELQEEKAGTLAPDADLHTQLGFLDLMAGDKSGAMREDQAALVANPVDSVAAGDLAVLLAGSQHLDEAIRLWQMVARNNPGETAAGIDLAIGSCMIGDSAAAMQALERVIAFSPDDAKARELLGQLKAGPRLCGATRP